MNLDIKVLKREIKKLKLRFIELEKNIINNNRNANNYYKEDHKTRIYIRKLKKSERDRFGKVCAVNRDV